jgi:hypothetical protein
MSPSKAFPHRPPSPVHEYSGPSKVIPVVDLSSDEEDIFPNIMRDVEFTHRLFGELNHELLGHQVTAMSSSSVTPMRKRCVRRSPPVLMPKPLHLLLGTPWPHPSPSLTPKMRLMECMMVVVMVEKRPVVLSLPRQEGYLQEAGAEEFETGNGIVLLATHILL